jgi:hypothetical protein
MLNIVTYYLTGSSSSSSSATFFTILKDFDSSILIVLDGKVRSAVTLLKLTHFDRYSSRVAGYLRSGCIKAPLF